MYLNPASNQTFDLSFIPHLLLNKAKHAGLYSFVGQYFASWFRAIYFHFTTKFNYNHCSQSSKEDFKFQDYLA